MAFRFQEVSGNSFAVSKELPNSSCRFHNIPHFQLLLYLVIIPQNSGKGYGSLTVYHGNAPVAQSAEEQLGKGWQRKPP